jgi:transglutaminase-like putative cysteine protease
MEPTQQHWLYALHYARSSTPGVMHSPDFRLFSPGLIEMETMYQARSWKPRNVEPELSAWRRDIETRLPPEGNPRTRQLAMELHDAAATDEQFVQTVLDRFGTEPYVYTLQPGALSGRDTIDQFLFQTRRGFCEHYASAFVFMMRAAGVPARVVAGYQGGETNPVNKTVIVHQFDAHAWAEVWLPGRGWVRADPTAAVSPARIELGLEQAVVSEGSFLAAEPLSPVRFRSIPLLNQIRLRYDALTYRWQSWVVGFDGDSQMALLRSFFGEISARSFATVFIGSWALVLIPVALSLLYKRDTAPVNPADKYYRIFCARLARLGLRRLPGEAPGEFALRAATDVPDSSDGVWRITNLYNELTYEEGGGGEKAEVLARFVRAVSAFKPDRRRKVSDEGLIV